MVANAVEGAASAGNFILDGNGIAADAGEFHAKEVILHLPLVLRFAIIRLVIS